MGKHFPLDLKKFKKVKEDAHSATLSHPDGHEITIAKGPLSKKMKGDLASLALADGGEVESSSDGAAQPAPVAQDDGGDDKSQKLMQAISKAGPMLAAMSEGGSVPDVDKKKAAEFESGFNSGGPSIGDAVSNAKKALGFSGGGQAPKPAPSPSPTPSKDPSEEKFEKYYNQETWQNYNSGGAILKENYKESPAGMEHNRAATPTGESTRRPKYAEGTPDAPVSGADAPQPAQPEPQDPLNQLNQDMVSQDADKQKQAEASDAAQPQGPNAQYAGLYQNELDQIAKNNPGLPPAAVQQMALDAAVRDKQAVKLEGARANNAAQDAYNSAQVVNQKRMEVGLSPLPMPQDPNAPAQNPGNLEQTQDAATRGLAAQVPSVKDPYGMDTAYNMWMQGMGQKLNGIWKEAAATGQLGQNQSAILQKQVENEKAFADATHSQWNDLNQERQHLLSDLENNHIDPKHYVNNMTTGDKIRTTIGLILGGFGAVAGQDNLAFKSLQANIDRDIQSQVQNQSNRVSMLNNNMQHFRNITDAAQFSHVMTNDILAHSLQKEAAAMAPGMAKAHAMQLAGGLLQDSSQKVAEMGMRRALMGLSANSAQDPQHFGSYLQMLRIMNPQMAKEMEGRYVPGVGLASVQVPQSVRDNLLAKQTLDSRIKDLMQWSSQHSGSLNPTDVKTGMTKAAELQSMYRNAINGGVFKKGEQEFIDNIIDSDPAKFFNNIRVLPKLKAVLSSNSAQMNMLKQSVGLPLAAGVDPSTGSYTPKSFKKAK